MKMSFPMEKSPVKEKEEDILRRNGGGALVEIQRSGRPLEIASLQLRFEKKEGNRERTSRQRLEQRQGREA